MTLVEAGADAATEGTGELLVVNSGDGRVRLEWAPEVVDAAFEGAHGRTRAFRKVHGRAPERGWPDHAIQDSPIMRNRDA